MKKLKYGEVFKREWAMYRKDHPVDGERESLQHVRWRTRFDGGVRCGEIRLFADSVPPRMALVCESSGSDAWQVIPLSEFTVPAGPDEALVGNHVYQFWNICSLPKPLVARSWIVAMVNDEEKLEIDAFYQYAVEGKKLPKNLIPQIGEETSGVDCSRLEYEKEFVLSESLFDYEVREPVVLSPLVAANIPLRYAAETDTPQQSCIICNEEYYSCELDQPFVSLRRDADPGTLVFSWKGNLPSRWHVGRNVRVTLHDRKSRRQIGEGRINIRKKEVVIDRFDGLEGLKDPVKKTCDAIIVLTRDKPKKR